MSEYSKRSWLILGAFLHDIGKFYQRAYQNKEILSSTTKKLQQYICPFNKAEGFFTHNHVLWTNEFFEKFLKKFNEAANFAIYHHKPEQYEHKIITLADWLSSGEREERNLDDKIKEVSSEPLISIFSQVKLDGHQAKQSYYAPVAIGSDITEFFPVRNKSEAINEKTNFKFIWDECEKEFGLLNVNVPFHKLFTNIFSLIEKYAMFVPSSAYLDKPHVSLFHHMKSTAAIATCLYDVKVPESEIETILNNFFTRKLETIERKDFAIIAGDISGIQDFIYSVTTKRALKGLRGRSFYLQMISEAIARYILDQFNLTECNLLYCGGGNFSILVPKLPDFEEKITKIKETVSENLFAVHSGNIFSVIGWTSLSYNEFMIDNFHNVIDRIKENMSIEKRRKLSYGFDYDTIFSPFPSSIDKELAGCEICGTEIEENQDKCDMCKSFESLSDSIRKADIIAIEKNIGKPSKVNSKETWKQFLISLGYDYNFNQNSSGASFKYIVNNTNFVSQKGDGWKFIPIYSPEGTLEDIAKNAQGSKKWAALRMDVDNLGLIFSDGLKDSLSISRFSMLSYMMNLFFTSGIEQIRKQDFEDCCVVYSGGDDLFVIGPWSKIPDFAMVVQKNFAKYTCHPGITISAGIFIAPSDGFPVYRAAVESGIALDKAKESTGKNSIVFFETDARWDEFENIKNVASELSNLIEKNKVSRSLLNIFNYGYIEKDLLERKTIPYLRIWRIFYAMKRFMERHREKVVQEKLEQLRKRFISSDYNMQPKLNLAVRWAELVTRKDKQRSEHE
ncbi:MAG TPA: type III-A CRISPR-associated protein Cas10/Csm1 [bacterium]|nr:type III-A CRISPR-associated protein Cas10/Csm1 [bacterium]